MAEITLAPRSGALSAAAGLDVGDSSGSRDEGGADACTVEFAAMVLEMQQLYDSNGLVAEASAVSSSAAAGGAGGAGSMGADTWGAEAAGALTPEASGLDSEEAQVQVRRGCTQAGRTQHHCSCCTKHVTLQHVACSSSCSQRTAACVVVLRAGNRSQAVLGSTAGKSKASLCLQLSAAGGPQGLHSTAMHCCSATTGC
jgi:hypothetical protein